MTGEECMRRAIALSEENVRSGGGPFAAVIVRVGVIVAEGANRVTADNDPTAHAEVSAIRAACRSLGTFTLSGCEIFTSCEPCPMCLGAIYWARISKIYYGNNRDDAARVGFDDDFIYKEIPLALESRSIPMQNLLRGEALRCFNQWAAKSDKVEY